MANITKTIYVNDSCITQSGSTTKRCSAVLSGDTDCISDYTVEDTEGGTSCCSDETGLCMNSFVGCPLHFTSATWKSTITVDGETYLLDSSTTSGTSITATYREREKLPAPNLVVKSNNDGISYTITYTNTSSLYSVVVFINGKSYDTLEPSGSVDFTYEWGEDTSASFTAYANPTDATLFKSSDPTTLDVVRPTTLKAPSVYKDSEGQTIHKTLINVDNLNAVAVNCYINGTLVGSIEANGGLDYTYTWANNEQEKTLVVKFVDPTSQYLENYTSFDIVRLNLTAPTLTLANNTYQNYTIQVSNPNDIMVTYYPQEVGYDEQEQIVIAANSTKTYTKTWSATATSANAIGYLGASGYKNSANSDELTFDRPSEPIYTLTVNYYISNVPSGTKYYEVGGSKTVAINDYKESITRATFINSDPSSDFLMDYKNQTLNMYYKGKLLAPEITESDETTYDTYVALVKNNNDVAVTLISQNLGTETVSIEPNATYELKADWGFGETSTTVKGYFSATSYDNSNLTSISIDRPSMEELDIPTLAVLNETSTDFDLKITNTNEVEVNFYYGYSSSSTTFGGTIAKGGNTTINLPKTTNKTIYVQFIYDSFTSENNADIPYLTPTTQLSAPTITLNSDKTTNTIYAYYIYNTNNQSVSVYINGVQQSVNLGANETKEYSGSWTSSQTSITIVSKFGTLSSSYTDSNESSLTINRPKIKLPNPKATLKDNNYSTYSFTFANTSSLYTIQPFFNGSSQGNTLEPNGSRVYSFTWGTGETSKTFTCYAMPTNTAQFSQSDPVTLTIERPAVLTLPEITTIVQGTTSVTFTVKNYNDTSVTWYVNNAQQSGAISANSTATYTYTWGTGETSKDFAIMFKDPTGQYGDSNTLTQTIVKAPTTLIAPALSSVLSLTTYTINIRNYNTVEVSYYLDDELQGTIAANGTKTYSANWAEGETSKTLTVKFTADGYQDNSKSITVDKPAEVVIAAPNLTLLENDVNSYKIRISNPNTRVGNYDVYDTNGQAIETSMLKEETIDKTFNWEDGETSKSFSVRFAATVSSGIFYSDFATLSTFYRPSGQLIAPILSISKNTYSNAVIDVDNANEVSVNWVVNDVQQSTLIASGETGSYTYEWQENETTKRFVVKFTNEDYDANEKYIDITRPSGLVAPVIDLLVNDTEDYKFRIKNKNDVAVYLYDEDGDTTKVINANSKLNIKGEWGSETTKTLKYYFVSDEEGQSEMVSITFSKMNEDDTYLLYMNIDGELYKVGQKYVLPTATSDTLGGIKLGFTNTGKNYKVQTDSNGNAYVYVPWSDTSYTLPSASENVLGGIKTGFAEVGKNYKVQLDANNNAYVYVPWVDYIVATTSSNGLMSSADKTKLDSIDLSLYLKKTDNYAYGVNTFTTSNGYLTQMSIKSRDNSTIETVKIPSVYDLPKATTTNLGGIIVGDNLTIDSNGKLSASTGSSYTLPVATDSALGGVKIGYTTNTKNYAVQLDTNNKMFVNVEWTDTTYTIATQSTSGLLSATDKTKLDNIESGANKYTLPIASASVLGGVKIGNNLTITSDGTLSSKDTIYTLPNATSTILGGIKLGFSATGKNYPVQVDANNNAYVFVNWTDYVVATQSSNGLMSASDKTKLDGLSNVSYDVDDTNLEITLTL